ncbi:MAG: hypothetical protein K6T17_09625 [Fimbriimonadales bacterium]|nr:hypothetical protein [Fimbriimonadales bacterium]
MRWRAKIAIIGAGSLRCGMPVLASLFHCPLPQGTRVALYDVHQEALDLLTRLARCLSSEADGKYVIEPAEELSWALDDATTIILCFGLGERGRERWRSWLSEAGVEDSRGRLALLARAILLNPSFEGLNEHLYSLNDSVTVINLVRPIELTGMLLAAPAVHLDWPPEMTEERRIPMVHHILRLVRGDEYVAEELKNGAETPLVTTLSRPERTRVNRFDPRAVAGWLAELEEAVPGFSARLLAT